MNHSSKKFSRLIFMRINIILLCCSPILFLGCNSVVAKKDHKPLVNVLIANGSFERSGGWQISAPPDYNRYSRIEIDRDESYVGKRSALVSISRDTGQGSEMIIHAWSQKLPVLPAGKTVLFGGWVNAEEGTRASIILEYEVITPRNGQTLFTKELEVIGTNGKFRYIGGTLDVPEDVAQMVILAGIKSVGTAYFDNIFVFIEPAKEQPVITNK